jgi:hypothetical protein
LRLFFLVEDFWYPKSLSLSGGCERGRRRSKVNENSKVDGNDEKYAKKHAGYSPEIVILLKFDSDVWIRLSDVILGARRRRNGVELVSESSKNEKHEIGKETSRLARESKSKLRCQAIERKSLLQQKRCRLKRDHIDFALL